MTNKLAQAMNIPGSNEPFQGPLNSSKFPNLASLITNAIPFLVSIAGILLLAYLLWGGFDFLTAMGDPKKAASGKAKITNAIIGFLLIFGSYWLAQIISYLFKMNTF